MTDLTFIDDRRRSSRAKADKPARATAEIVALLRGLRERMALVRELEPDNRMLREYQYLVGWSIIELRSVRADAESALRRRNVSASSKKAARATLQLVALVESELDPTANATH